MTLEISNRSDATIVRLEGHLDASNSVSMEEALLHAVESSSVPVVIDLGDVSYISSEGLRLLMVTAKKAAEIQLPLALSGPTPFVQDVLKVSMFTRIFTITATVEEAIDTFYR